MTAPARTGGSTTRTRTSTPTSRTATPQRERTTGKPASQPERTTGTRGRSAAAERAYARRAQRSQQPQGPKPERKPGSASRITFVVLVMGLLVVGVVATLWFATQATADAYRLEQAKQETNRLSDSVQRLQQQVAQQDSPPSLAQKARQLGMVPAGDPAHLVVGPDGKVTVVGVPSVAAVPTTTSSPPPPATNSNSATTAPPPAGG